MENGVASQLLAARCVPDFQGAVVQSGYDHVSDWAKRNADVLGGRVKRDLLSTPRVPKSDRGVAASSGQPLAPYVLGFSQPVRVPAHTGLLTITVRTVPPSPFQAPAR
jgi:hypothetical protein